MVTITIQAMAATYTWQWRVYEPGDADPMVVGTGSVTRDQALDRACAQVTALFGVPVEILA